MGHAPENPLREAAIRAFRRFCEEEGLGEIQPEESREERLVILHGTAPEGHVRAGARFWVGYEVPRSAEVPA